MRLQLILQACWQDTSLSSQLIMHNSANTHIIPASSYVAKQVQAMRPGQVVVLDGYQPAEHTRLTTNFANLARGATRQQNLRNTLDMINQRFNALANWDNPTGERYSVELEIVSVDMDVEGNGKAFPSIEILKTHIVDHQTGKRIEGVVG